MRASQSPVTMAIIALRMGMVAALLVVASAPSLRAHYERRAERWHAALFAIQHTGGRMAIELGVRHKHGLWGAGQIVHSSHLLKAMLALVPVVRSRPRAQPLRLCRWALGVAEACTARADADASPAWWLPLSLTY